MGGKRRLKAGAVRLLGRHAGAAGRAFRRAFDALAQAFDLSTPLARLEASRVAAAWVNVEVSTRAREAARRARPNGRGRPARGAKSSGPLGERQQPTDQRDARDCDRPSAPAAEKRARDRA